MLINYKKQLSITLLLMSSGSLIAMQHHVLNVRQNNQSQTRNSVEDRDCSICFNATEAQGEHRRQRLTCGHAFGLLCINAWRAIPGHTCPLCRRNIVFAPDMPHINRPPAPQVQNIVVPEEPQAGNQPGAQRGEGTLSEREQAILGQLISELSPIENDRIDVLLMDAYDNPLILIDNDFFMNLLTNSQKDLVNELVLIAANRAGEPEPLVQPAPQRPLTGRARQLLQRLITSLAPRGSDEIDNLLIGAYTNPSILIESPAFMAALNNDQRNLVNDLIFEHTR
jgi:Ring finger domain